MPGGLSYLECDAEAAHHALLAEAPVVAAPQVYDQSNIRDCDQPDDQRVDVHGAI
jgi:hypothetical protein